MTETNIEKLKKKFSGGGAFGDEGDIIMAWEDEVKRAMLTDNLSKHDGMKMLVKHLTEELQEMRILLASQDINNDVDIFDRKALKHREALYKWILNLFSSSKATVRSMKTEIKEELDAP